MKANDKGFLETETRFLKEVSITYRESLYHKVKRELIFKTFEPYVSKLTFGKPSKGVGLQLGCSSDGYETAMIAEISERVDVVEGCSSFIERQRGKWKNVKFIHSLFENFKSETSNEKYDHVWCNYVLEHVVEVDLVLAMIKDVLKPEGLLFIVTPNYRALSRQLALEMNIIPGLKELTENDRNHGHRRVYDRKTLNDDLGKAGFSVIQQGGIIFKILADFQMDRLLEEGILGKEHIEGLYKLGLQYPDFADSMYAVCSLRG
jgi:SAM-dependent methyltransferase